MKRIIADTNILLAIGRFRLDIFSELNRICQFPYEIFILDKSINELNYLTEKGKGKDKDAAKLALQMIGKFKIIKTETDENVDDILAKLSDENTYIITQDKELKKRIKKNLIVLRQKKYLKFI